MVRHLGAAVEHRRLEATIAHFAIRLACTRRRVVGPAALSAAFNGWVVARALGKTPRLRTSAEVYEFRFAASAHAKVLLDRAKALKPDFDVGEIFEAALEGLVATMEKNKFKTTERPRSSPTDATAGDPRVSAAVKRAVYARDDGRCTFRGANGHHCGETARLETASRREAVSG